MTCKSRLTETSPEKLKFLPEDFPAMPIFRVLFLLCVLYSASTVALLQVSAQGSTPPPPPPPPTKTSLWKTLSGDPPLVVARGGFSGLFPDSSSNAYDFTLLTSLSNVIVWCDVQLTKDAVGICLPSVNLDKITNIQNFYKSKVDIVNGVSTTGWFSVDYTFENLQIVTLIQATLTRTAKFDTLLPILTVEDVARSKPPGLWLNVQHDAFFTQHNLSMRSYVLSVSRRVIVSYVSSPEVGFLRGIAALFKPSRTKLVFRFLGAEDTEPSTNQTYSSLLKNLTFVKTFASGILVPKSYIWPVNVGQYLQPHTSVVADAHKAGLEIFASDFANDATFSYNYSYNPVSEYLNFIDNGDFSVDGVLSDFPITPSAAIDCFSHMGKNSSDQVKLDVVSHNGASGIFPDSTDLAYNQAIQDGADYIDCTVQMTQDGIPICLSSIDLLQASTVTQSTFSSLSVSIPEIQSAPGIFTFNLTWKDIRSLKPAISNPFFSRYQMVRNPAYKNAGKFVSLADFLTLSMSKPIAGVLINIENAAYLAEKQGLGVISAVLDVLGKSGYNNQTAQEVVIQSTNKAVLTAFKKQTKYKLMYMLDENIRSATNASLADIKSFADSVAVSKKSVFPDSSLFLIGSTDVFKRLHSFNLSIYVYVFTNEYVSQAWDFFSDPFVEINSYVMGSGIEGVITNFPGTAVQYKKNRCLSLATIPPYMNAVVPGDLLSLLPPDQLPPAQAPYPVLEDSDVAESPLPPVSKLTPSNSNGTADAPGSSKSRGHHGKVACFFLSSLSMLFASLLLF